MAARARTDVHARRGPAGAAQRHRIGGHRIVDGDGLRRLLRTPPFLGCADRAELGQCVRAAAMERQLHLLRRVGVPDGCCHGETIELALDEREGAALRIRVLRGNDQMGVGERPGLAVHADLPLLHRLEERRLRTWRCPVQLVHQHDVREDRARPEIPTPGVGHEDRHPRDVGREEVGVTLYPREVGAERGGERAGQHRLAHPGHVLNEEMTAREGGHRGGDECALAAEDDLAEVADQGLPQGDGVVQVTDALVDDAHRIPAIPWAMGVNTTGARFPTGARPFGSAWLAEIPITRADVNCRCVDQTTGRDGPGGHRLRRRSNTPDRSSVGNSRLRACPASSRRRPGAGCPDPVRG